MKILMLTPYLPYPLLSGGQIRTYNLLKNLAGKHEITLFSFIREKRETGEIGELLKYCRHVKVIQRRKAWDWKNIILAAFTPFPFLVSIYLSLSLRRLIKKELAENNYDLIHAETFYVMPNLPKTKVPILLVEQTIEYLVYQNFVKNFKFLPVKPLLYFDVAKIQLWEKYYWRQAARLVTMSEEDKRIVEKSLKQGQVDIVANGVDFQFFNQTKVKRPTPPTVLFVGNFKWLPNKDAALYLTKEIWPQIKKRIPKAKLWIVGKNPTPEIKKLADEDIKVDEGVEDIRNAFAKASVLLAPIRNGRGTKYKVLEAMATGLPVVTTPLGIEGIEAKEGQEVLIAEESQALANQAISLLKDKSFGEKMARKAKIMVRKKYNWQIISNQLDRIYRRLPVLCQKATPGVDNIRND